MEDHSAPFEPPPVDPPAPPTILPWEDATRPWPNALFETIGQLVGQPRRAFEGVPPAGDVLRPVLFALIVGSVGVFFNSLWELTLGDPFRDWMPAPPGGRVDALPRIYYVALMGLSPLLIALSLILSTCVMHVALLLVGGARSGFVATLRALCYAQVGNLALVLPLCGTGIGALWILGLEVLGLAVLHRISIGRSLAGVLVPVVLCCGCFAIVATLFGAALLAGLKGLTP